MSQKPSAESASASAAAAKQEPKKEKPKMHFKQQKFYTADINQASGTENANKKSITYKQGGKCKFYKFICKF